MYWLYKNKFVRVSSFIHLEIETTNNYVFPATENNSPGEATNYALKLEENVPPGK